MMHDVESNAENDWENAAPIYIGSTKFGKVNGSDSRFYSHFKKLKNGKMTKAEYDSVKCIRMAEVPALIDARTIEKHLIGKYVPTCKLYNTQFTKEGVPIFEIDTSNLVWKTYSREKILSNISNDDVKKPRRKYQKKTFKGKRIIDPFILLDECVMILGWCPTYFTLYYADSKPITIGFIDKENNDILNHENQDNIILFSEKLSEGFEVEVLFAEIPYDTDSAITVMETENQNISCIDDNPSLNRFLWHSEDDVDYEYSEW